MPSIRFVAVLALVLTSTACYHATVDTGLRPSGEIIEKDWAHGWLGGLVPPSDVDVAAECPNGVAQVETKHSFLNQLASGLTWGIYAPISIRVLCAIGPDRVGPAVDREELSAALTRAALESLRTGAPAEVRF
jgi:hypothetical protein